MPYKKLRHDNTFEDSDVIRNVQIAKVICGQSTGGPAIAIGALFVGIFPISLAVGIVIGNVLVATGSDPSFLMNYAIFFDLGVLALIVITAIVIASIYGKSEEELNRQQLAKKRPTAGPKPTFQPSNSSNPFEPPTTN